MGFERQIAWTLGSRVGTKRVTCGSGWGLFGLELGFIGDKLLNFRFSVMPQTCVWGWVKGLGVGFLGEKLWNFRFSGTHQTCGQGCCSCGTNCWNSGSRVRTKGVIGIGLKSWRLEVAVKGWCGGWGWLLKD